MSEPNQELLKAALRLANKAKDPSLSVDDLAEEIAAVEKFRPAPEPRKAREWWVNVCSSGFPATYRTEEHALNCAGKHAETVHVREVLPVEWERWEAKDGYVYMRGSNNLALHTGNDTARRIAILHNSAMEALAGKEGK